MLYPLPEVLLLVLCATLAGADDFVEIEAWGGEHLELDARRAAQPPVGLGEAADEDLLDIVRGLETVLPGFQERVEGFRVLVVEPRSSGRRSGRA